MLIVLDAIAAPNAAGDKRWLRRVMRIAKRRCGVGGS